jgi:hypothetical protein
MIIRNHNRLIQLYTLTALFDKYNNIENEKIYNYLFRASAQYTIFFCLKDIFLQIIFRARIDFTGQAHKIRLSIHRIEVIIVRKDMRIGYE